MERSGAKGSLLDVGELEHSASSRWLGYGLTGGELDFFVSQAAGKIQSAWEQESRASFTAGFNLTTCQRIINRTGRFASNVIARAWEYTQSEDERKKEEGSAVLQYWLLPAVVAAVTRVQDDYFEVRIEQEELIARGLLKSIELIRKVGSIVDLKQQIPARVGSSTYREGMGMVAGELNLPMSDQVTTGPKAMDYIADCLCQTGQSPSLADLTDVCRVPLEVAEGYLWSFPAISNSQRVPAELVSVSLEETAEVITMDRRDLRKMVSDACKLLSPRKRRVLQLRFGLEDGQQRILEEVGTEFGVTSARIRQIETKAIRKLRHPAHTRKFRDYLK